MHELTRPPNRLMQTLPTDTTHRNSLVCRKSLQTHRHTTEAHVKPQTATHCQGHPHTNHMFRHTQTHEPTLTHGHFTMTHTWLHRYTHIHTHVNTYVTHTERTNTCSKPIIEDEACSESVRHSTGASMESAPTASKQHTATTRKPHIAAHVGAAPVATKTPRGRIYGAKCTSCCIQLNNSQPAAPACPNHAKTHQRQQGVRSKTLPLAWCVQRQIWHLRIQAGVVWVGPAGAAGWHALSSNTLTDTHGDSNKDDGMQTAQH